MKITDISKQVFYKLFWTIFAVTLSYALYQIFKVQYNIYNKYYIFIALIYYTALVFIIWYLLKSKNYNKCNDIGFIIAVISIATMVRIVMIMIMKTEPVSDFSTPHDFYNYYLQHGPYTKDSSFDFYQLYYTRFPSWYPYMKIIRSIYNIFGFNVKYIIILNIFLNAITMIVIYYAGKKAFSKSIGTLAMIIFGFAPSLIIYSGITTPDHFSMLLISLVILAWIKMDYFRFEECWKKYIFIIITCFLCAILNLFKPLSILFLIVFLCIEFAVSIIPNIHGFKNMLKNNYRYWICFVITFLLLNIITTNLLNFRVETFTKKDVVNSMSLYLYTGWGVDDKGNYSQENNNKVLELLFEKYGSDQKGMIEEVKMLSKQQFKDNKKNIINILNGKFIEVMSSEYSYYGFANTSSREGYVDAINNSIGGLLLVFSIIYMVFIYLSILILSLVQILSGKLDRKLLFLGVTIFGYLMIVLISAVQSRYKSIIMPCFSLVAAYTVRYLQESGWNNEKEIH